MTASGPLLSLSDIKHKTQRSRNCSVPSASPNEECAGALPPKADSPNERTYVFPSVSKVLFLLGLTYCKGRHDYIEIPRDRPRRKTCCICRNGRTSRWLPQSTPAHAASCCAKTGEICFLSMGGICRCLAAVTKSFRPKVAIVDRAAAGKSCELATSLFRTGIMTL